MAQLTYSLAEWNREIHAAHDGEFKWQFLTNHWTKHPRHSLFTLHAMSASGVSLWSEPVEGFTLTNGRLEARDFVIPAGPAGTIVGVELRRDEWPIWRSEVQTVVKTALDSVMVRISITSD